MDVRIYDTQLNLVGLLDNFSSLSFTSKYNKAGQFTIKAAFSPATNAILRVDNIIYFDGIGGGKAGFIQSVEIDIDDNSTITATGYDMAYLLARRIVWDTITFSGSAEDFIRKAVNDNCITVSNQKRLIPFLELGAKCNAAATVQKQVSFKGLFDTVSETALAADIGFRIVCNPENKKLVFSCYVGEQTGLVFNRDYDNVLSVSYIDSKKDYVTAVKCGGKGEGAERAFISIDEGEGLGRYELFVDAKDIEQGTDSAAYQQQLMQRATDKKAEHYLIRTFDGVVNTTLDTAYPLGGMVKFFDKELGVVLDTRITEIQEIYEGKGRTVNLTFGNNVPSIYDKLRGLN